MVFFFISFVQLQSSLNPPTPHPFFFLINLQHDLCGFYWFSNFLSKMALDPPTHFQFFLDVWIYFNSATSLTLAYIIGILYGNVFCESSSLSLNIGGRTLSVNTWFLFVNQYSYGHFIINPFHAK